MDASVSKQNLIKLILIAQIFLKRPHVSPKGYHTMYMRTLIIQGELE